MDRYYSRRFYSISNTLSFPLSFNDVKVIYSSHKILPDDLCDVTLEALDIVIPMEAYIGNALSDRAFRKSKVRWLRDNEYWHDLTMFIQIAGSTIGLQYWNYEDLVLEPLQLATYEEGDFYDWHLDSPPEGPRRLSLTLQLSDKSEYEGGDLEFKEYTLNAEAYKKGSITMFDSSHKHRISPIVRGVRHSLVGWFR